MRPRRTGSAHLGPFVASVKGLCLAVRIQNRAWIKLLVLYYAHCRTPEESISALQAQSEVAPEIQDDFELDVPASELDPSDLRDRPEIQARLAKRIASTEIKLLQQPRPGKKLLVLDIDYTLFDLGSTAERPEQLARPFLHEFLATGAIVAGG